MDMLQVVESFGAWLAPIISSVLTAYAIARINFNEKKRERRRVEDEEWRNGLIETIESHGKKLDELVATDNEEIAWREKFIEHIEYQDGKIELLMNVQAATMRSDIIHKCHRYLDDLGEASIEEKDALHAQWEEYTKFCLKNGIKNAYIDELVQKVKNLPNRTVGERPKA